VIQQGTPLTRKNEALDLTTTTQEDAVNVQLKVLADHNHLIAS